MDFTNLMHLLRAFAGDPDYAWGAPRSLPDKGLDEWRTDMWVLQRSKRGHVTEFRWFPADPARGYADFAPDYQALYVEHDQHGEPTKLIFSSVPGDITRCYIVVHDLTAPGQLRYIVRSCPFVWGVQIDGCWLQGVERFDSNLFVLDRTVDRLPLEILGYNVVGAR